MAVSPFQQFFRKKQRGECFAVVSLYDALTAALCVDAGVDMLLVGDSLGNVVAGYENTVPVTMDVMAYHTGAVVRGVRQSSRAGVPVIADMPFGSYHSEGDAIVHNCTRLMQAGAHAVKVEGANAASLRAVQLFTEMGAPVVGHIGYTPQAAYALRGTVQGRTTAAAAELLEGAQRLQDAGCVALVLEAIPAEVAATITGRLEIPTIGIGAGPHCDGQVLIWHDLVGLTPGEPYTFVKRYAQAHTLLRESTRQFIQEVHSGAFPGVDHGWNMDADELARWQQETSAGTDAGEAP